MTRSRTVGLLPTGRQGRMHIALPGGAALEVEVEGI